MGPGTILKLLFDSQLVLLFSSLSTVWAEEGWSSRTITPFHGSGNQFNTSEFGYTTDSVSAPWEFTVPVRDEETEASEIQTEEDDFEVYDPTEDTKGIGEMKHFSEAKVDEVASVDTESELKVEKQARRAVFVFNLVSLLIPLLILVLVGHALIRDMIEPPMRGLDGSFGGPAPGSVFIPEGYHLVKESVILELVKRASLAQPPTTTGSVAPVPSAPILPNTHGTYNGPAFGSADFYPPGYHSPHFFQYLGPGYDPANPLNGPTNPLNGPANPNV